MLLKSIASDFRQYIIVFSFFFFLFPAFATAQTASELFEGERLNLEQQYARLQDDLRENIAQFDEVTSFIGELTGDIAVLRQRSSAIINITKKLETSLEKCERHAAAYIRARSETTSSRVLEQFDRTLKRCRQGLEDELSGLASLRVTVVAMLREERRFDEELGAIEPLLDNLKAQQDTIRESMREYNESLGIVREIESIDDESAPIDEGSVLDEG